MAEALKNITQIAPLHTENTSSEPAQEEKKPWDQQEGESMMWFNRFTRYLHAGPKRTLKAAVEQEREHIAALKSPKKPTSKKKSVRTEQQNSAPLQVPGSWKVASTTWRWAERARAWDAQVIDEKAQVMRKVLAEVAPYTSRAYRVLQLNNLANVTQKRFDKYLESGSFPTSTLILLSKQMQSLLRDIAAETALLDGVTQVQADAAALIRVIEDAKKHVD
jgi:hypothetical protein